MPLVIRALFAIVILVFVFQLGRMSGSGHRFIIDKGEPVEAEILTGRPRVDDGDSLRFSQDRVRLFGIDAFEREQKCWDRHDRRYPCGHVASRALESLVRGNTVTCEVRDVDTYGRKVAVCHIGRLDLAAQQVREGYALAYRRYSRDYVQIEKEARAGGRGAWAGRFDKPWDWRHRGRQG